METSGSDFRKNRFLNPNEPISYKTYTISRKIYTISRKIYTISISSKLYTISRKVYTISRKFTLFRFQANFTLFQEKFTLFRENLHHFDSKQNLHYFKRNLHYYFEKIYTVRFQGNTCRTFPPNRTESMVPNTEHERHSTAVAPSPRHCCFSLQARRHDCMIVGSLCMP